MHPWKVFRLSVEKLAGKVLSSGNFPTEICNIADLRYFGFPRPELGVFRVASFPDLQNLAKFKLVIKKLAACILVFVDTTDV